MLNFFYNNYNKEQFPAYSSSEIQNIIRAFKFKVENNEQDSYDLTTAQAVIDSFKTIISPDNEYLFEDTCWQAKYYLASFYLHSSGYVLEQFPCLLEHPKPLPDFATTDIRTAIKSQETHLDSVPWDLRRIYISKLNFILKSTSTITISSELNKLFADVSLIDKNLYDVTSLDKVLETIINLIERILKKNGKYIDVHYDKLFCHFISKKTFMDYKQLLQNFRHHSEQNIVIRTNLSNTQKLFLIDFGLTILKQLEKEYL